MGGGRGGKGRVRSRRQGSVGRGLGGRWRTGAGGWERGGVGSLGLKGTAEWARVKAIWEPTSGKGRMLVGVMEKSKKLLKGMICK